MKNLAFATLLVAAVFLCTGTAQAQLPFSNTVTQPTTSPYLNLLNRQGGLPNYQSLVRPQIEARQEFAQQQAAINRLQRQERGLASRLSNTRGVSSDIRGTGHVTQFQYFSHFFPTKQR